jgi:hypothetical protein
VTGQTQSRNENDGRKTAQASQNSSCVSRLYIRVAIKNLRDEGRIYETNQANKRVEVSAVKSPRF